MMVAAAIMVLVMVAAIGGLGEGGGAIGGF